jgi:D-lyxose ketol-isomerase
MDYSMNQLLRSEINSRILGAQKLFGDLPYWAGWTQKTWAKYAGSDLVKDISRRELGYRVTPHGLFFTKTNAILFPTESEVMTDQGICLKDIYRENGMSSPTHYHIKKKETYENRGPGDVKVTLWKLGENDTIDLEGTVQGVVVRMKDFFR